MLAAPLHSCTPRPPTYLEHADQMSHNGALPCTHKAALPDGAQSGGAAGGVAGIQDRGIYLCSCLQPGLCLRTPKATWWKAWGVTSVFKLLPSLPAQNCASALHTTVQAPYTHCASAVHTLFNRSGIAQGGGRPAHPPLNPPTFCKSSSTLPSELTLANPTSAARAHMAAADIR